MCTVWSLNTSINTEPEKGFDLIILNSEYNVNPLFMVLKKEKRIYMKKILENLEIKKFNKLLKNKNIVPVSTGDELLYLYDTELGLSYYPKYNEMVVA